MTIQSNRISIDSGGTDFRVSGKTLPSSKEQSLDFGEIEEVRKVTGGRGGGEGG